MAATVDQLTQALIAADKAGNTDDAKVLAQELASARAAQAPAAAVPKPQADPPLGQQVTDYAQGMRQGVYDVPQSVAELLGRAYDATGLPGDVYKNMHQTFTDASKMMAPDQNKYTNGGRVVGQMVATAPLSELKVAQGAGLLPAVVNGVVRGASSAALTSSSSDAPLAAQLGVGAAAGGALPPLGRAISSVVSPVVNPMAQKLLSLGVRLTPGQILGGGFRGAEDKLASIPVLGSFVASAQKTAVTDFNRAALSNALSPIGAQLPASTPVGRQGVDYVANKIGDVYNSTLPQMTGVYDNQLQSDLSNITSLASGAGVKSDTVTRLGNVLNSQILDKADPNGQFSGSTLKGIQSELSRIASEHSSSDSADDRILGGLVSDSHQAFNDMLLRNNPAQAPQIQAANAAWARYSQIRKAASMVGAKEGIFSGPQFANAVKATDNSVQKGNYARGNALSQDVSDAATSVLPQSVPDSGTAGRLLLAGALAGGHATPLTAGAMLPLTAATMLYTQPGQAIARAALTGGQTVRVPMSALIQQISNGYGPAAAGAFAANSFAQVPQGSN